MIGICRMIRNRAWLVGRALADITAITTIAAAAGTAGTAAAADFPTQPVTIIVAGAPAGGTDSIARTLASDLTGILRQSVVVDNKAGAGGIIGTKALLNAAPDGHTLLMGHVATNAIVPAVVKPRPYDPLADFTPVALVGTAPDLLVVSSQSGIRDLAGLLALGRSRPDGLSYGSPGVGLPQHISGFALSKATGVPMVHVPYRGSAPALVDLIGNRISMMFVTPGAAVPYLKSGQLHAIAVTSAERNRFFPEVPTLAELGHSSLTQTGWFGVFAPAGTPAPVVETLRKGIATSLSKGETQSKLEAMYLETAGESTPGAFAAFVRNEVGKWAAIVNELGVTAE
jgi:tripartite-type tricarboxylate transporter receptor subunit TctC